MSTTTMASGRVVTIPRPAHSDLTMRMPMPKEPDHGRTAEYALGRLASKAGYGLYTWRGQYAWLHSNNCVAVHNMKEGRLRFVKKDVDVPVESVVQFWESEAVRSRPDADTYPGLMFCRSCICHRIKGTEHGESRRRRRS